MNQRAGQTSQTVSVSRTGEGWKFCRLTQGGLLPAGSSLSRDLVMSTDREPEMPDLWLRATCFIGFCGGCGRYCDHFRRDRNFCTATFDPGQNTDFDMESCDRTQSAGIDTADFPTLSCGDPVPSGTDHRECCDPGQSVGISCDLV